MGLLDIFSQSYFTNKREEERAAKVRGLLGQPAADPMNSPQAPDGLGPIGYENRGSGLLGGQMSQPQFAAQLMGIPGYGAHGVSLMNNAASQQGAMDRQMVGGEQAMQRQTQAQDYAANNMSQFQQRSLAIQGAQAQAQQALAAMKQQYGIQEKRTNRIDKVEDEVYKVATTYAPAITAGRNLENTLSKVNGDYSKLNGMDALEIQSQFLTAIRPNEAQMEGDLRQLADAMGFGGKMEEMWNFISSNTPKKPEHLAMMGNIIRKQAEQGQRQVDRTLTQAKNAFDLTAREEAQVTYRVPEPYEPVQQRGLPKGLIMR